MVRSAAWLRSAFSLANAFSTGFGAVGRKVEEAERRWLRWRRTAGPCGGERLSIPGESSESDPLNEVAGGNPPTNEAGPSRTKSTGSFDFKLTVQYALLLSMPFAPILIVKGPERLSTKDPLSSLCCVSSRARPRAGGAFWRSGKTHACRNRAAANLSITHIDAVPSRPRAAWPSRVSSRRVVGLRADGWRTFGRCLSWCLPSSCGSDPLS